MSKPRLPSTLFWIVVAAIVVVPAMISARQMVIATDDLESAKGRLQQTVTMARQMMELRSAQQTVAERKRPDQDVIARVNECLADCGIPSDRFGGQRPEADSAVNDSRSGTDGKSQLRKQSVLVTLNDLTIAEIGALLSYWNSHQPLWTPTRMELLHSRDQAKSDRYSLNLLLSATYVADGETPTL
jgi:hypothetical protein